VKFKNLSLAITDEQHRFGVNQRALISGKSDTQEIYAHALVMSATPIPRTLALIMYGDLDVSVVNEAPPGRQRVDTFAVDGSYRERIYNFTRKLINEEGGQVYIVCPLVGEDEEPDGGMGDMKSVRSYYKELSEKIFPDISSGFVHGKLKASEKDLIMEKFRAGEVKILVSTVVIEVGVNVPNAVLMIIENAERFGLSQLHQLRGRVGRGDKKSYCVLFSDNEGEKSEKRLDIMTKTNDGFEIAKKDIEIRGPGDLFGEKQSGAVKFKIADLAGNADILYEASRAAKEFAETAKSGTDIDTDREACARLAETAARMFEDGEIAFN
jgi:ATP-dependent DNA helicase RecG